MMSKEIKIEHLGQHKDAIPEIVSWLHAEWGHKMPEISIQKLVSIFEKRITRHKIPQSFVTVVDGQPVGTASMVQHDMSTRMDLTPWLAAVYIKAEYRGRGIGSQLVQAFMDEAVFLGLKRFYLFTPDRVSFYTRLGWQVLEEATYRSEQVTIMFFEPESAG